MQIDFSNLVITRFNSANRLKNSPLSTSIVRRDRSLWAIALKVSGKTVYHTESGDVLSDARHPVVLPRGSSYSWKCTAPGECLIVEFDCTEMSDTIYSFHIHDNTYMKRAFVNIEHESLLDEQRSNLKIMRELYNLLIFLSDSREKAYFPQKKALQLQPAVQYIAENYGDAGITNAFLAGLCRISVPYFRRLFSQCYHISPIAYLNTIRMNKAQQLLQSDYGSISQVAESMGYNSIYHFSKEFRLRVGMSPKEYAKRIICSESEE